MKNVLLKGSYVLMDKCYRKTQLNYVISYGMSAWTTTKVITLANRNRCKQHNEPIRIRSKYM